jgi:hypothetical protein
VTRAGSTVIVCVRMVGDVCGVSTRALAVSAGGGAMDISSSTRAVCRVEELFSPDEELALVGFLAGYGSLTRDAYALDLRQYATWCTERRISLFGARRATSGVRSSPRGGRSSEGQLLRSGCARSPASTATQRRRPYRGLTCGPCSAAPSGLRVPRHGPGSKRGPAPCWSRPDCPEHAITRC